MTEPTDPDDEIFHPAGDEPYWNESGWFGFNIADRDINGFVYYFHDVRTGIAGGGPALWDPSGEEVYNCLFYDWRWNQPPTGALDYRDFELPNSLRHRVLEPAQRYQLSYSGLGLDLELEWTALMPLHELGHGAAGSAPRHLDQPGRMTGTATLNGDRLDIDCYSLRDRTWGEHRPGARRSGDYLWAIASPDDHWHAITVAGRDAADIVIGGYLMRDGHLGELVRGTRKVLQRNDGAPSQVVLEAEDDHGRTLRADGNVRTALRWLGWPGRMTFWTLTDWRWDGVQGYGEDQEFFAREQVRSLLG